MRERSRPERRERRAQQRTKAHPRPSPPPAPLAWIPSRLAHRREPLATHRRLLEPLPMALDAPVHSTRRRPQRWLWALPCGWRALRPRAGAAGWRRAPESGAVDALDVLGCSFEWVVVTTSRWVFRTLASTFSPASGEEQGQGPEKITARVSSEGRDGWHGKDGLWGRSRGIVPVTGAHQLAPPWNLDAPVCTCNKASMSLNAGHAPCRTATHRRRQGHLSGCRPLGMRGGGGWGLVGKLVVVSHVNPPHHLRCTKVQCDLSVVH